MRIRVESASTVNTDRFKQGHIMNNAVQYTGHLPGSSIQAHSAGPSFPAVIYAKEFEGDPHTYWGVIYGDFDYGVWRTHADAEALAALVKQVRDPLLANIRVVLERSLALHFDKRAARAGLTPAAAADDGLRAFDDSHRGLTRDEMPVDGLHTPLVIRMRYGYTRHADQWLMAWGYNPLDFQAHGERAKPRTFNDI